MTDPALLSSPLTRRVFIAGSIAAVLTACSGGDDDSGPATSAAAADSNDGGATTSSLGDAAPATTDDADGGGPSSADDSGDASTSGLTVAQFDALPVCALLPSSTAGPFPLDEHLMRRDITEGYPGHPLQLGLRVVDADCAAVPGALVEIWHADATGDYSAFEDGGNGKDEGAGTTFCRGSQIANDDGIAEFATLVPGWYPGRAVHIHLRVWIDDVEELTAQLYFDGDVLSAIYTESAYADNGLPDTTNSTDGLAGDVATDGTLIVMTTNEAGSLGLANLGIPT